MTSFFSRMVKRRDIDKAESHIDALSEKAEELIKEVQDTISAVNDSHSKLLKFIEETDGPKK